MHLPTRRPGIGCVACEKFGITAARKWATCGNIGRKVRLSLVKQHGKTQSHRTAVKAYLTDNVDELCIGGNLPPSAANFQALFDAVLAAKCQGKSGLPGVGGEKKIRQMKWALAEGFRVLDRRFLRSAGTVSLHQDGRKGRLAMRYRGCNELLEVRSGALGQIDLCATSKDLGALGIAEGTMAVLTKICTKRPHPPYIKLAKRAGMNVLDKPLLDNLKRKIELMDTDAAADEQRAAKVLKSGTPTGVLPELTNLKMHNLDKAHSSRRTVPCTRDTVACPRPECVCGRVCVCVCVSTC
jgi:hypothetical protein